MDLRQLQYFITVADKKSINKSAQILYTTQPNVSKVISSLEKELDIKLFDRSNRGVKLTNKGKEVYDYANEILKNHKMILSLNKEKSRQTLNISSYPNNVMSEVICDYYNSYNNKTRINFIEGQIENITENVKCHKSEIGIIYTLKNKRSCFNNFLEYENLEYKEIATRKICLYVGKNNKFFNRENITIKELLTLKFVQRDKDIFSIENYLVHINKKIEMKKNINFVTNSDNLVFELLLRTDIATIGIDLKYSEYNNDAIKRLEIKDQLENVSIGFVKRKGENITSEAFKFIELLKTKI